MAVTYFATVADYGHLLDILVLAEAAFNSLRSDVFSIGCLEEVLDTVGKYERSCIVNTSGVACAEPSVGGERLGCGFEAYCSIRSL